MDQEDALILLEKVSKSYGEGENVAPTHVLSEVDLKVSSGQTLAIVGPSGSGKSSLLNILGALDQATSGKVMVAGRDLNACNEAELAAFRRTTIGFVFQSHHLLPQLSVVENVLVLLFWQSPRWLPMDPWKIGLNNFSIEWGCLIGWIIVRGNFLEVKDSALLWFEP